MRPVVVLPQPDSPDERERLAATDVEVEAVDGLDRADLALQQAARIGKCFVRPRDLQQGLARRSTRSA